MARKPRIFFEGAIYHVTFRGNARQTVFMDDADRERFKERMAQSIEDYGVRLYLYCMMTNHVHLLLETPRGNLSQFMSSLLTGYTVFFNRRHRRVGHLTQGRYGAELVEGDNYLLRLSRYIHLNPVCVTEWKERELKDRIGYLRSYRWSSYRGYTGLCKKEKSVDYGSLSALIHGKGKIEKRYRKYVEAGLIKIDEEIVEALKEGRGFGLGSDEFRKKVRAAYEALSGNRVKEEDVALRQVRPKIAMGKIMELFCKGWGIEEKDIRRKRRDGTARAALAWLMVKWSGATQREVANYLGMKTGASVSELLRNYRKKLMADKKTNQQLKVIEEKIVYVNH